MNFNNLSLNMRLKISAIIIWISFFCSFFLSKSLLLNLTISLCIASCYYWMVNMYPESFISTGVTLLIMIVKYYLKKWSVTILKKQKPYNNCLINQYKNEYFYSFKYNDPKYNKNYIFKFNEKHRSNDLIIFKDEFDNDITDLIEPYLGPLQNFHGISYTPFDFNHKIIKVFRDGNDVSYLKTFEEYDVLKL